jgi:hypothetical protein
MIIGIDLDNTLIDYRDVFWQTALTTGIIRSNDWKNLDNKGKIFPSKNAIKNYLLKLENGDFKWEFLQGQVYGKYIYLANIFPGVANFLLHCRIRNIKVHIISHKTKYGHHDKSKTLLREAAIDFLDKNDLLSGDFGISKENIFFFDTRKEKVNKIAELNCSFFIDDLPAVFEEPNFPKDTEKILFYTLLEDPEDNVFRSWKKINEKFFNKTEPFDVAAYITKGLKENVKTVEKVKGRGNSSVYKIQMQYGQEYACKLYPDLTFDNRDRMEKEIKSYRFLHKHGIFAVPEVIYFDKNLNIGIFEWINGSEINQTAYPNVSDFVFFIEALAQLSKQTWYEKFELASAACLSGQMIEYQIRHRYQKFHSSSKIYPMLKNFLENVFLGAFNKMLYQSKKLWPGKFESKLSKKYQLLSPSDFGFHNAILTTTGFKFIDFEYFGWDDPVKLTCDFLLHPGMLLKKEQKNFWLAKMKDIFFEDIFFQKRLIASYCLYGLCWCLIQLNVFATINLNDENIETIEKYNLKQKQCEQLKKSEKLLRGLNDVYKYGFEI